MNFPIVIMGIEYWSELLGLMQKMARFGTIDARDLELVYATDSVAEAVEHISKKTIEPFGLKRVPRPHLPWLGERGVAPQPAR